MLKRVGMAASTENTHTTADALIADIELSRSRGYAVDEGEQEIGVRCFAVPLLKWVARDLASEFDKEAAG